MLELFELNKLNDISSDSLASGILQRFSITIQLLHQGEFFIADADHDNGARETGSSYYALDCLLHVVDFSVCQNQKHMVDSLLLSLSYSSEERLK